MVYFSIRKLLNLLWQIFYITGLIFIAATGPIFKHKLIIWSHCFWMITTVVPWSSLVEGNEGYVLAPVVRYCVYDKSPQKLCSNIPYLFDLSLAHLLLLKSSKDVLLGKLGLFPKCKIVIKIIPADSCPGQRTIINCKLCQSFLTKDIGCFLHMNYECFLVCSVWPDLAKFCPCCKFLKLFCQSFEGLFSIWSNIEATYYGKYFTKEAKYPNIEKII